MNYIFRLGATCTVDNFKHYMYAETVEPCALTYAYIPNIIDAVKFVCTRGYNCCELKDLALIRNYAQGPINTAVHNMRTNLSWFHNVFSRSPWSYKTIISEQPKVKNLLLSHFKRMNSILDNKKILCFLFG